MNKLLDWLDWAVESWDHTGWVALGMLALTATALIVKGVLL